MVKSAARRKLRDDSDSPWKGMMDLYLPFLIALLNPELYALIDWKAGIESLDPGLKRYKTGGKTSSRYVDKLVRIRLLNGERKLLLVHIEVQSGREAGFPERIFLYAVRIREDAKLGGEYPLSLVILADGNPGWRPKSFEFAAGAGGWSSEMKFDFPIVKILDFEARRDELMESDNPFAWFILAQLDTIRTKGKFEDRAIRKLSIAKSILKRMPIGRARSMLEFLDCLMTLPDKIEHQWYNDIYDYTREQQMPYVSIFEREGLKKGLERGREEGLERGLTTGLLKGKKTGKKEGLLEAVEISLEAKFGEEGLSCLGQLAKTKELSKLREYLRLVHSAATINEFRKSIE